MKYNNCHMIHYGNIMAGATYNSNCVIGAGTWTGSRSYITNGYYDLRNVPQFTTGLLPAISYHNNSDSTSVEYVFVEGAQLSSASNMLQFYGFQSAGSTLVAYVNNLYSAVPIKITGTASKIQLNQYNVSTMNLTPYQVYTGGTYNGHYTFTTVIHNTMTALGLIDDMWHTVLTVNDAADLIRVDAYYEVPDSSGRNYWSEVSDDNRVYWRATIDDNNVMTVQLRCLNPYSYHTVGTKITCIAQYTKL